MMDERMMESYKKVSYFTQSSFSSIQVYKNLITSRKLELSNQLLFKIIENITQMLMYYSEICENSNIIIGINNKLEFVLDAYKNSDYYLIRDILEYDMLPVIEGIFRDIESSLHKLVK